MLVSVLPGNADDGGFITKEGTSITRREFSALTLIASGMTNEEGAQRFNVNVNTFRNHIYNLMKKLGAKNRTQALALAVQNGMLEIIQSKQTVLADREEEYYLCVKCGRVFRFSETIEIKKEPIEINHVKVTPPPELHCPYSDCNGSTGLSVDWNTVRKEHPEYPEVPVINKLYDFNFGKCWNS
ncbi:MAG: helix-turn-helix transcriptional regulator [Dehalococcoidales bacterium]|nr:helix-turn-helix transcriptional regulator [Dehalococcoidales bacterium]